MMKLTLLVVVALIGSISCHLKDKANKMYIGAALASYHMQDGNYAYLAGQEFNCMTPENEMKWDATEPSPGQYNYGAADSLVSFAQQHGMKIRGHTLVWHSQYPQYLNSLDKNSLQKAINDHIWNEVTHFKGKIYAWDVVNEVFNEDGTLRDSIFSRNFGDSFIANAFRSAHQADPNAKLYINDYNVESINPKSNGLYNLVKNLLAQGVPIHGVGLQSHMAVGNVPGDLYANMKRFSDLGVDVALTELDLKINGAINDQARQQQANDYATVIKYCVGVPRCVGVTVWGIVDKYSWITSGEPCLWWDNYQPKSAYWSVNNALQ